MWSIHVSICNNTNYRLQKNLHTAQWNIFFPIMLCHFHRLPEELAYSSITLKEAKQRAPMLYP